jgi:hypothetical protein
MGAVPASARRARHLCATAASGFCVADREPDDQCGLAALACTIVEQAFVEFVPLIYLHELNDLRLCGYTFTIGCSYEAGEFTFVFEGIATQPHEVPPFHTHTRHVILLVKSVCVQSHDPTFLGIAELASAECWLCDTFSSSLHHRLLVCGLADRLDDRSGPIADMFGSLVLQIAIGFELELIATKIAQSPPVSALPVALLGKSGAKARRADPLTKLHAVTNQTRTARQIVRGGSHSDALRFKPHSCDSWTREVCSAVGLLVGILSLALWMRLVFYQKHVDEVGCSFGNPRAKYSY